MNNMSLTPEQHKQRHIELHKALDELAADWLDHQSSNSLRMFSNTTIAELMEWSHEQTINPTEKLR